MPPNPARPPTVWTNRTAVSSARCPASHELPAAWVLMPVIIIGGIVLSFFSVWLRAMLAGTFANFVTATIAGLLLDFLVNYPLRAESSTVGYTPLIHDSAKLPVIKPPWGRMIAIDLDGVVPTDATAVAVQVTAVAGRPGFLTAHATGTDRQATPLHARHQLTVRPTAVFSEVEASEVPASERRDRAVSREYQLGIRACLRRRQPGHRSRGCLAAPERHGRLVVPDKYGGGIH